MDGLPAGHFRSAAWRPWHRPRGWQVSLPPFSAWNAALGMPRQSPRVLRQPCILSCERDFAIAAPLRGTATSSMKEALRIVLTVG
eukprot:9550858-Alexandrium_andersonii.AAC.1